MNDSLFNVPFVRLDAGNLSDEDKDLLGPLLNFVGEWSNDPYDENNPPQGWNLISIPGPAEPPQNIKGLTDGGFFFETIPYYDTITFTPIAITSNFGTFDGESQQIQRIGALLYDQRVKSAGLVGLSSEADRAAYKKYFAGKGFDAGDDIHAELGMLLNISNYNDGPLQFARMGTIPHGNAMLCLGSGKENQSGAPDIAAKLEDEKLTPFPEDPKQQLNFAYGSNTIKPNGGPTDIPFPFYPLMDPRMPYEPLVSANDPKKVKIQSFDHFSLSTTDGTGGLLSIPFTGNPAIENPTMDTTQMDVHYWMSKIGPGPDDYRLQYFQNIRIVFPFTGDPKQMRVVWPHIGMNTLKLATRVVW